MTPIKHSFEVRILKGIPDGAVLSFDKMGHMKIEGHHISFGKLNVSVNVKAHERFRIEGFNILSEEQV